MKFFRRQKIIKIVLTLFVASSMTIFLQPLFAAELSGTKLILSKQTIGDPNQVYAVTDANFIEGGHMQVPNRLAMLGNPTGYIPGEATSTTMIYVSNQRRKLGMLVTDLDDSPSSDGTGSPATYRLVRNRFYCDPAPALGELDRSADGNQDACATTIMSDWQLIIPSMSTSTTAGKFLTNDGQNISWGTLSGGTGFTISGVGILDASTTLGLSVGSGLIGSFGYSTSTISLDLTHANEWSGLQTFDSGMFALKGSATGTVRLLAAASSTDYLLTLPDSLPATSGLILASDASGTLSWAPQATGTIGGTISAGQVAFGTSTDTIAGTNNFLFTNGLNPFFSVGDLTGAGHGTALTVNDATQNISATGTVSVVLPHAVGSPVITGDTSLGTFSGTYDGYAGYPYGIGPSIDGINDQTINYTSETGAFVPGDTVTGVPSGASGTVGTDASGTLVIINNTGGIPFAMGDTITDVSTSFTLTADISVSSFYDSFTYDDGFTYWGVYVPIDVSTPYVFGDGLSFTFTPSIGHYIGENLLYSIYDSSFSPAITINGFDGTRYFTVNAVARDSNFIGYQAGQGATHANNSNFMGLESGLGASYANNSNFLGANAGNSAINANNSNFLGLSAGQNATYASDSNFLGTSAGISASNAGSSNFFGFSAGNSAINANNSNFLGANAGNSAANANFSNFLGANAGDGATNANNAIFIGKKAGISDTVNNSTGGTSILIGDNTGTGGNSNSVAIGAGAVNTAANQFLVKSTSPFTDIALDSGTGVFRAGDLTGMSGAELLVDSNKQTIQLNGTQVVKTKTLPYGATYTYSFTGMLGNYDIEFHSGSGLTVVVLPDSAHSSVGEEIRFTDSDNLIGTSTTSMTFDSGALNTITRPGSSPAQTFSLNTTDYQGSRIVFTETSNSTSTGVTNWQAVIIKNSTGGGSITLAPNQVGFASTTGTLIGTNNFLFNDNGINPVLNVGDLTGVGNGTAFSINDSTRQISATGTMSLATVTDMNVFSIKNSVNNYFSVNAVANLSTFIGVGAGHLATNANFSNFLGANAGDGALNASSSNFFGTNAGAGGLNAKFSNFLGASAGQGAASANNSIFLGNKSGYNDTVNNSSTGTSILIGDNTGTGGNSNSVAIGAGAVNTAANQFLVKSTSPFTDIALDSSTGLFRVGDLSSAGNGTKINLSDSSKTINASGNVSVVTGYSLGSTTCALTCSPNDITITGTYTGVGPTTYSLNIMTPAIRYQYVTVSNITGYVPFGTVTATGLRSGTVVAIFPTPGFAPQGTLLLRINSLLDFSGVSLISAPLTTVISTSANTDYVRLTEGGTSVYFGLLSGVSPAYPAGVVSSLDGIGVTATTQYNHTASIFTASVTPAVSTTPTSALKLDFNNQKYQFGDYAYSENGNALSINDASNSTLFTSKYGGAQHTTLSLQGGTTGLFSIGDVDNAVHGTKISINDNTQAITFNGHYSFPFSDGLSGQTLSTNGSGVLSWATSTSGTSTFSGSIALGQVAFGSATNTISGNGDFLFTASSTPIFKVGDILNAGHFTKFVLNDASGTDSFYNNIFSIYDNIATTSKFLDINSASGALGHASIGDINNLRGGGYFSINNMSSSWSASISDYAGGATTTYFRVSPSSKSYSFGNPADTNITIDDTSTSTTPKTVLVTASDLRIVSPASSMTPDAFTIQDIPGNRYFTVNAIIPNLNAIGVGAGVGAGSASDSNFIGVNAGNGSTAAYESNFLGYYAGSGATSALGSNFLGADVGLNAINASRSNFFGSSAGVSATNANNSNFFGYNSGNGAANANNSIFLGNSSGYGDIVNNSGGGTSILIGDNTNTGGHSDSVAIGNGAVNTAANQFLIRATSTHAFTDIALDSSTGTMRFGDLLNTSSSTKFVLDATSKSSTFYNNLFSINDNVASTSSFLNINTTAGSGGSVALGDINNLRNSGVFSFNGMSSSWDASITDQAGGTTNTYFQVAPSAGSYFLGNPNSTGLYITDSTSTPSLEFRITNPASSVFTIIDDSGLNYFTVNAIIPNLNAIGAGAGVGATSASHSNFFGYRAGSGATSASYSNFFGSDAGYGAAGATGSNFLGESAGYGAVNADGSNFFGYVSGYGATGAEGSNFFGNSAGYGASNAQESNFLGGSAGQNATNASYSNFFGNLSGVSASNANNSNFFGANSGYQATNASSSNFFGLNAGIGATNANNSNFLGYYSGGSATSSDHSNFIGYQSGQYANHANSSNFIGFGSGYQATNASSSNFLGVNSGTNANNSSYSNFFGTNSGWGASSSSYSNFMGYQAGFGASSAKNSIFIGSNAGNNATNSAYSIFIGNNAGLNDTVSNGATNTSILIGSNTNTGGYKDSVAIGNGAVNTSADQFLVSSTGTSSFKNMRFILKTGVGAGGKFEVQDNSLSSNKFLSLDASTDTYSFGDITGYNNSSYIKIEDSSLPSDGLITMNHSVLSVNSSLGHTCTLDPDVSGSVTCTSDVRLKTNINNLPDTLAQINSLRPVTYNWISSGTSSDLHTGFIAQEMQKVFPQFVSVVDTKNGYLGIDYGALTVPIVKAIQEMDIKLEPLTSLDVTQDGSLASLIKKYLENALNGIQVLFAGKVQTKELCLDDLCVTKTELQQMMNQANVQGAMLIVPPAITSTTTATTTTTDASSTTVSTSTSLFVLPVISTSTSTATTTAATVTATSTPDTSSSSTVSIVPITAPTPVIAPVSVSTDTNSAPVVVPSLGTTVSGSATTTQ